MEIRPLSPADRPWVAKVLGDHFASPRLVSRGVLHDGLALPGLVARLDGAPSGLLLHAIRGTDCEVVALVSLRPREGIATALLDTAREIARDAGCRRLWLVTTNDNRPALELYARRGWTLVAVHEDAVTESRRLKPEIPETGHGGVPIRDELEFQILLSDSVLETRRLRPRPFTLDDARGLGGRAGPREVSMGRHREALGALVAKCAEADPDCGVQLQGSVARGDERPDSDIDITVVLSRPEPLVFNEIIARENHFGMTRARLDPFGVDVDVNWLSATELLETVESQGAVGWWMFYRGTPIHDPKGLAKRCHEAISDWFGANPGIAAEWEKQQAEVERHKRDPRHVLRHPAQPEFCAHLKRVLERQRSPLPPDGHHGQPA